MRIAINGIGVAGPTLAYWLRRAGHEPVLFEKAPALRTGGYMIDFWGVGYEIADRMGLIPTLRERAYLMERLRTVDSRGRTETEIDIAPIRERLKGRFFSLSRADLAAALFGACAGIEAHFGLSIEAIEPHDDGVVAALSDGRAERFDVVVGADGLHSRIRELTFGPEPRFEKFLDCWVAAFRLPRYPRRDEMTYVSHTVVGRQAARVSLRDDETLILLICRGERVEGDPRRTGPKKALRGAFSGVRWEVPEILDRMEEVEDVYFDSVSQIRVPRWFSDRVCLIGDAAACPSLLAGEGTGLGMVEAYVLAEELDRAHGDFAGAFAAYDRRLREFVTGKQKGALGLRGFFAPRTTLGLWVRNVAVRAMSIPFVAQQLLGRSLDEGSILGDHEASARNSPGPKAGLWGRS